MEKDDQTLLAHGVYYEQGYGFIIVAVNDDGLFNISMVTPKETKKQALNYIDHYLNLFS